MLKNKSIVTIDDVSEEDLKELFSIADDMEKLLKEGKKVDIMQSKIMCTLFYEPSTRTRLSFESAMHRLGGSVITMADVKTSSVSKGETLADTIRMADSYSDMIVIRHPLEGAARLASRFTNKPIINAGDGSGQHPTQTIMDLYTIRKELGHLDGINVLMLGDLKYGRTVHSLILALSRFNARITLVSPESLRIPDYILKRVSNNNKIAVSDDLDSSLPEADVVYVTRIQRERFTDPNEYQALIGSYSIDSSSLEKMKKDAIIMHPLPRVDEISAEVDRDPRAAYFRQASNGVPVRMALISKVMGVM